MKIWFDISNSPHINFFASMIRDLEHDHEIIITCRPLANTIELLTLHGFPHAVVGKHYGASTVKKLYGYPVRVFQLYEYLRPLRPDVAISHSSFHSPIVARMLGIRGIYLNDNEHALGNVPSFLCASTIMIPEFLDRRRIHRQGARDKKIVQYPGVKEGVYLWNLDALHGGAGPAERSTGKKTVYVRPEPWTAQYYSGEVNFMDDLLLGLQKLVRVVLLPRGALQGEHYMHPKFAGITVADKPMGLADIAPACDLFIGAGGTMTREMAVLGIPTISVYRAALLEVDQYLLRTGHLIHRPDLDSAFALRYLEERSRVAPDRDLLTKGRQAYGLIKDVLLHHQDRTRGEKHD
jgi:predicted glycosyltransferase